MKKITFILFSTLFINLALSQPVNDDPAGAIMLDVGLDFAQNVIVADNIAATASEAVAAIPDPLCGNYLGEDVWFTVVVPGTGNVTIETALDGASAIDDTVLQVYSGAIGAFAYVECDDDGGSGFFSRVDLSGRTPGEILYVRIFSFGAAAQDTFQISAFDAPPPGTYCLNANVALDDMVMGSVDPTTLATVIETQLVSVSSNSGSGAPENTDFTVPITADITITFFWSYTTPDGAAFDNFGYLVNGSYTQLTDDAGANDQTGTAMINLIGGDTFGFRSNSIDSEFGGSTTTIGNFSAGFIGDFDLMNWTNTDEGDATTTNQIGALDPSQITSITASQTDFICDDVGDVVVTVTVTNVNGTVSNCNDSTITVSDPTGNCALSVEDVILEGFSYYPNPVKDVLTINTVRDVQNVSVYNLVGKQVLTQTGNNSQELSLNMSNLAVGVYFMEITTDDNKKDTFKILKE